VKVLRATCVFATLFGPGMASAAAPASAGDWTPHTAAALLDTSFPTADACQRALDDARKDEGHARPVHGLSYARLFAQGRCHVFHESGAAWRIRMHWTPRTAAPPKSR